MDYHTTFLLYAQKKARLYNLDSITTMHANTNKVNELDQ